MCPGCKPSKLFWGRTLILSSHLEGPSLGPLLRNKLGTRENCVSGDSLLPLPAAAWQRTMYNNKYTPGAVGCPSHNVMACRGHSVLRKDLFLPFLPATQRGKHLLQIFGRTYLGCGLSLPQTSGEILNCITAICAYINH